MIMFYYDINVIDIIVINKWIVIMMILIIMITSPADRLIYLSSLSSLYSHLFYSMSSPELSTIVHLASLLFSSLLLSVSLTIYTYIHIYIYAYVHVSIYTYIHQSILCSLYLCVPISFSFIYLLTAPWKGCTDHLL